MASTSFADPTVALALFGWLLEPERRRGAMGELAEQVCPQA